MPLVPSHIPRQLSNTDDYAHTLTHAQSTGGKCHRMNVEILPQSHFDQAAVPADARRRRTDRNFRSGLTSAANEWWCADVDTTSTSALGSNVSIQRDLRRRCHTSLRGWNIGGYDIRGHTLRPRSNEQSSTNCHHRTVITEQSSTNNRQRMVVNGDGHGRNGQLFQDEDNEQLQTSDAVRITIHC